MCFSTFLPKELGLSSREVGPHEEWRSSELSGGEKAGHAGGS